MLAIFRDFHQTYRKLDAKIDVFHHIFRVFPTYQPKQLVKTLFLPIHSLNLSLSVRLIVPMFRGPFRSKKHGNAKKLDEITQVLIRDFQLKTCNFCGNFCIFLATLWQLLPFFLATFGNFCHFPPRFSPGTDQEGEPISRSRYLDLDLESVQVVPTARWYRPPPHPVSNFTSFHKNY